MTSFILQSAFKVVKKDWFIILPNVAFFLMLGLVAKYQDGALFSSFKPENFVVLIPLTLIKDIFKFSSIAFIKYLHVEPKLDFKKAMDKVSDKWRLFLGPYILTSIPTYLTIYFGFVNAQPLRNMLHIFLPFLEPQASPNMYENFEAYIGFLCLVPLFCVLEMLPVSAIFMKKEDKPLKSTFYFVINNKMALLWYFSISTFVAISSSFFAIIFTAAIPIIGETLLAPVIHAVAVTYTYAILFFFFQLRRTTTTTVV